MSTDATRSEQDEGATTELVAGTVGDRCTSCGQPLASDQRYCVACGQRRGKPRFSFESLAARAAPAEPAPPKPHRSRVSSATTLVAGIATLLLAMGVGVLIGHSSNNSTTKAAASPQIITVGGAGGGATAAGASSTAGGATAAANKHHKVAKVKTVTVHLTQAVKAKANAAAAKVFGNNSGNLVNNPTEQVGQACSGGAGCQNGKFSGNFFPGG